MKLYVTVLALLACVMADDDWKPRNTADIKIIRSECLKEHPLSEEQKSKMKEFEFPDEEPVRQYLLCTALKMDIFCPEKGYHPERIAQQFKMDIEEAEVLKIAKGCVDSNEEGSAADVWAFRGHKCLMTSKIGEVVKNYLNKKREEAAAKTAAV